MSQLITYLPTTGESCTSIKPIAPIVGQKFLTIATGTGTAPLPLLPQVAVGDPAFAAGVITNEGCAHLQLSINYIVGADCDSCTADTLTELDSIVLIVPPSSSMVLPQGLISRILAFTGSVIDPITGLLTASNVTKPQKISWYSSYPVPCSGPVLVPAP